MMFRVDYDRQKFLTNSFENVSAYSLNTS